MFYTPISIQHIPIFLIDVLKSISHLYFKPVVTCIINNINNLPLTSYINYNFYIDQ